jgi:hypothetical protein
VKKCTVRHVQSVHSDNVTTLTFEITNQTSDQYIALPLEVQVRNGNDWTKFQGFDHFNITHPITTINPKGFVPLTVDVTNLPAGSVVRFKVRPQKLLTGVRGFLRGAELKLDDKRRSHEDFTQSIRQTE